MSPRLLSFSGPFVEVVDTGDEWEGLVGIVETLYDSKMQECSAAVAAKVLVFFPVRACDVRYHGFVGINSYTQYVQSELLKQDGLQIFDVKYLIDADI
jgi:hypothetical protein